MALKLQLCIKIKFFKKTKKVVYISANCTYNVNIKKVKEKLNFSKKQKKLFTYRQTALIM